MLRLMINGFGRIGRAAFKIALEEGVDVARINDVVDTETLAYLLRYDSVYGVYPHDVEASETELRVGEARIPVSSEKSPSDLPHGDDGVDVVLEGERRRRTSYRPRRARPR